jgi:hypothetical protein
VGIVVVVLDVDVLLLVELVVGSIVLELVEVVEVVVLVDVVAPLLTQAQALPSPDATPPAAAHVPASGAMPACSGRQQTTASGRPHVDRHAQPTTARRPGVRHPAVRSAFV